ncbi:MAG: CAP domain-containing protein, partial [Planctomycetota bacterium]
MSVRWPAGPVLLGAALVTFASAGAAGGEDKPLRVSVRAEDSQAMYLAQLLGEVDHPVRERIELPGAVVCTKIEKGGRLRVDPRGDGKFFNTVPGNFRAFSVALRRDGVKTPKRIKLLFRKQGDGSWTFRNATQLTMRVGADALAAVDVNANGVWNEPAVDGMTWGGSQYLFPLPKKDERWCTPSLDVTGLDFGPWGEDAKLSGRALATKTPGALGVLKGVNEERVKLGLTPRPENVRLSEELQSHCKYMASNNTLQHHEEKGKPGYSPEGHKAGMRSILAVGSGPERVALGMVNTYFHRQDVIRPQARGFGVGYEGRYSGIDGRSDLDKSMTVRWPVLCPAPDQEGVGVRYSKESPDAVPGDDAAGYPITAYFGTRRLGLTSYKLRPAQITARGARY